MLRGAAHLAEVRQALGQHARQAVAAGEAQELDQILPILGLQVVGLQHVHLRHGVGWGWGVSLSM